MGVKKKEKVPVTFFDYKKYAVRAAKELCYPQETVEKKSDRLKMRVRYRT